MRAVAALLLLTIALGGQAGASHDAGLPASPAFGAPGAPRFDAYPLPAELASAGDAGEPTIGIPWDTDHVFFQAFASTHRAVFDEASADRGAPTVTWTDVTPPNSVINVDPMLHVDAVTGRIWAGGLLGPCSVMGISDDDGGSWATSLNMCSLAQFDHQSIGSGPWADDLVPRDAAYPHGTYYCAQLARTACVTSLDGGVTWLPPNEVLGACGGLHGHIRVSPATGHAAVPHGSCGGSVGFAYSADNGLTWDSRVHPDADAGPDMGFDPSIGFSWDSGWLYLAQADETGIHVALSKDEGLTWEPLGGGHGEADPWLRLNGLYHDPVTGDPLVFGTFADVQAGDDDRAAVTFLATTDPDGREPFSCGPASDPNIWHYYLARTFDAGATWEVHRLWDDPVQVGGIWDGGGGEPCRNLLDFNDMDIDSEGRIHVGFADGCIDACADAYRAWQGGQGEAPVGADSREAWGTILRQTTGRGLFAAHDEEGPAPTTSVPPTTTAAEDTPAPLAVAVVALAAVASSSYLRRR